MKYVILSNGTSDLKEYYKKDLENSIPLYYVSYQTISKLKMNRPSYDNSPLGIYAYPLRYVYDDIFSGGVNYGRKRLFIFVLKLKTDKVLRLKHYKRKVKDYSLLEKFCYKTKKEIFAPKAEYEPNISSELYKLRTFLPYRFHNTNYDNSWVTKDYLRENIKRSQPYEIAECIANVLSKNKKIVLWNKILQNVLHYDAVLDEGQGIINHNELYQIVFLNSKAYEIVSILDNDKKDKYRTTLVSDDPYEIQDFHTAYDSMDY